MKNIRDFAKLFTIVLILTITIATTMTIIPSVNAAVIEVEPNIFVMFAPNPVGVDEQVLVVIQLDKTSPTAYGVEGGEHFTGFNIEITKPDETNETVGPGEAFATSGYYFIYTPSQVGTYTFQATFPGQTIVTPSNYIPVGTTPYLPDTTYVFKSALSQPVDLVVVSEPTPAYPDDVMDRTDYWERPINAENKGWYQVADNWLMEGYDYNGRRFPSYTAFAPYTSAPNSAHVLWKRPLWFGGIGGGKFVDRSYYSGLSYEQPYLPLILQGRIIYAEHDPVNALNIIGTRCLDLYTGEELWFMEDTAITFAQVLSWDSPNEHGLIATLWSQSGPLSNITYQIYDGFTGKYQFTITNVSSGGAIPETVAGPRGEILNYAITGSGNNRRMVVWNSTKAILDSGISGAGIPPPVQPWEYYNVAQGAIADGKFGIQMNVSLPNIPGPLKYINIEENLLITHVVDPSTFPFTIVDAAYDTRTGTLLWNQNITDVYGHYAPNRLPYSPRAVRDGIRVIYDDSKLQLHGYDLNTGNEIWVTDPYTDGWSYFNQLIDIAYGRVYQGGYDGHLRAYDAETGNLDWDYFMGTAGHETHYNTWPAYAGFTIADRKIFFTNDDHSPDSVIWRGGKLRAINADNGDEVWSISGWFRIPAVADGYLTATNSLDGQIYVFGKGPSKTTVTASPKVTVDGSSVMIEGTVLDMSPGQSGTPAISDEDQGDWMEYLHMQKKMPTDAKGVNVKLTAIDSNGNPQEIGIVTTDIAGKFGKSWTPPNEGDYTITATFEGTESYGSSFSTTYIGVGPAPSPGGGLEPEAQAPLFTTETVILTAVVVIAAVAVVAYWILRRR